ncbi:MAG: endonuclease/exonuclease/phosphatase family protein [Ginsengibacter sp.]
MASFATKFIKSTFVFINICIIACYLLVCIVPYIDTSKYWYVALLGLLFPLLFFALLFFIIIWAFAKSRWCWVSIIVLLLGIQQITATFGFHLPHDFNAVKKENTLRVLQWNVTSWDENNKKERGGKSHRQAMFDLVKNQNADILCFEEFFEPAKASGYDQNIGPLVKLGYPYYYFVPSVSVQNEYEDGVAIFSKYPIIDSAYFSYGENTSAENLLYADVKVQEKTIRVIATHLQSVRFKAEEYQSLSKIKHTNREGLKDSRTIVAKLKTGYTYRYSQGEMLHQQIAASPFPVVVCGDFNDVPNSSTYFTVRQNLQDAFLKTGFFIGRTFRFISPTLRIDYIFANKKFRVSQTEVIHVPYSDHYPVEADLEY